MPAGHHAHVAAPPVAYSPGPHARQYAAPGAAAAVPGAHGVHSRDPGDDQSPAAHTKQAVAFRAAHVPAAHVAHATAPGATETVPLPHATHSVRAEGAKDPGEHARQAPSANPPVPAPHARAATSPGGGVACPAAFAPKQTTVPFSSAPHACPPPAAMDANAATGGPGALPQHSTRPLPARRPQLWNSPAETLTKTPPGAGFDWPASDGPVARETWHHPTIHSTTRAHARLLPKQQQQQPQHASDTPRQINSNQTAPAQINSNRTAPASLAPKQATVPFARRAHVCCAPHETVENGPGGGAAWPMSFSPKHASGMSERTLHVCQPPAETAAKGPPGASV